FVSSSTHACTKTIPAQALLVAESISAGECLSCDRFSSLPPVTNELERPLHLVRGHVFERGVTAFGRVCLPVRLGDLAPRERRDITARDAAAEEEHRPEQQLRFWLFLLGGLGKPAHGSR